MSFRRRGRVCAQRIPDFRGENGLYAKEYDGLTAEMLLSHSFFCLHPDIFYDFYKKHMLYPNAKPNIVHVRLAEMERTGRVTAVVTAEYRRLAQESGKPKRVRIARQRIREFLLGCGKRFGLDFILKSPGVPRCPECGDIVRPEVTLYGEPPDHWFMTGACREISNCDTLIVAGTSLLVEPAASCLEYFRGRRLIVINRDKTPADARATLVLHEDVAGFLKRCKTHRDDFAQFLKEKERIGRPVDLFCMLALHVFGML